MSNTAFQVGNTYNTGRGDYVWTFTVTSRTAKFVTLEETDGDTLRVGVKVDNHGVEWALPFGSFSMAPVINAGRMV